MGSTLKKRSKKRKRNCSTSSSSLSSCSSSSSSSSDSIDSSSTTSSSSSSSSSSEEEQQRTRKKNKLKKKKIQKDKLKLKKKLVEHNKRSKKKKKHNEKNIVPESSSCDIPVNLMEKSKSMAPMTKEEWEKRQNSLKRVYDESTGRYRLIKGDGEVVEEIVSKDRHKEINKSATRGDGQYFQSKLNLSSR